MEIFKKLSNLIKKASPKLKKRLLLMFIIIGALNIGVWVYALLVSKHYPILLGLISLAYGLGLRHAVDADHIAAIDNTVRKMMRDGKRPVAVGFFFSLGHSTIVILLSILVAFSASFVKNYLPSFQSTGSLIGSLVSSFFLLLIGVINLVVLIDIFKIWKRAIKKKKITENILEEHLETQGLITRLLRPLLKAVGSSWNMYFVGFLFGLGFDTASEVALLSISAASGASGIPIWQILILPLAFTAGMALVDTLDGILMLGAYGWADVKPIRKLYYNLNITFISVLIALLLGGIQATKIFINKLDLKGGFFDLIANLDFGYLGYFIIGTFLASWILSVAIYKYKKYDLIETK